MKDAIHSEFSNLVLEDKRLEKRALKIVSQLVQKPDISFPRVFDNSSELEAFYRFIQNPYFGFNDLLSPHIQATLRRLEGMAEIVVAHDTTEFVFAGNPQDLGTTSLGKSPSYFGHFSLAIHPQYKEALGVIRSFHWKREKEETPTSLRLKGKISQTQARRMPTEKDRWQEGIFEVSALLKDTSAKVIHVCDSETDSYKLLTALCEAKKHFVIRGCYNRKLGDEEGYLREKLSTCPVLYQTSVELFKRGKKSGCKTNKRLVEREARKAVFDIKATRLILKRSAFVSTSYPKTLNIHVVYALETSPLSDTPLVEWILLTNLDISDKKAVSKIIDYYRCRWLIEEYFKVLKTGCNYEKRRLGDYDSLRKCLGLFIPIAWLLLYLKCRYKNTPQSFSENILPAIYLEVLEKRLSQSIKTHEKLLFSLAQLGGHIKRNGPPGWLTLWRGIYELSLLVQGYKLAMQNPLFVKEKM